MKAAPSGTTARGARPTVVYHALRELIVRGQLAPGARIVESDVATRLHVSRTPVRGALQRLQQEGYIVDSPSLQQSRPTVAPMTREDAMELFSIVAEIEGLAARYAAHLATVARDRLVTAVARAARCREAAGGAIRTTLRQPALARPGTIGQGT